MKTRHCTTVAERAAVLDQAGFALIAVLVVLGMLVALTAPFLLSMGHGEAAAVTVTDEKRVALAAQSARDVIIQQVARGHECADQTPMWDTVDEFPLALQLPKALHELGDGLLLSGETEDAQRRIHVHSATPLLYANLLGLAAHLVGEHGPQAEELLLDDGGNLPEPGWVVVDCELIRYGRRDGNTLKDLQRGQRVVEDGFVPASEHTLPAGALVLDYRAVLAVTWPFDQRDAGKGERRRRWQPHESVDSVARIREAGFGAFTPAELDRLRACCTVAAVREQAADFGKPERIFEDVGYGERTLRVRSSTFFGAGTVVRIKSLDGKQQEYGLVWSTEVQQGRSGTINLEQRADLRLLLPVTQNFRGTEAFVEALLPHPVNLNTAGVEVLAAVLENLRENRRGRPHRQAGSLGRGLSKSEAQDLARRIVQLREEKPFEDFEDLCRRLFVPLLQDADAAKKQLWMLVYESLLSGRSGGLEMTLLPIAFRSGPVIQYRAASALDRPLGTRHARHEVSGLALAMPDRRLDFALATQWGFEEALRIDRQSPFWLTGPINVGAPASTGFDAGERGTDPAPRQYAHFLGLAFPGQDFGEPRFPPREGEGTFQPSPSTTPFHGRDWVHASMYFSRNPEGRDVPVEGAYGLRNNGPRARGQQAPAARGHEPTFPFTEAPAGFPRRAGLQFWFKPRDLGPAAVFDLAGVDIERNRVSVQLKDGHLVLEVLDEAGLDPTPGVARSSPERTAGTWRVPVQDIHLEADVWYHVNLAADGNRPSQMTLLVDGIPRGQPELRTFLTQAIAEYTYPQGLQNWRDDKGRFLEIRVESTKGFPPRGVLRIGLELFEYTSCDGTTFYCRHADSSGGRTSSSAAGRMRLREFRPEIPLDVNGRPTIDIDRLTGGQNLDVAPPHPAGAAVELYGYSLPIYRDHLLQVGAGRLTAGVGPFGVARAWLSSGGRSIDVQLGGGRTAPLGEGIDETYAGPIDLADPLPDPTRNVTAPPPAGELITSAFPTSGGYALLVQWLQPVDPFGTGGASVVVGGYELIRYASRQGTKLTGIQRAVTVAPNANKQDVRQGEAFYDGRPHKFVTRWLPIPVGQGANLTINMCGNFVCYVVPVSLPVSGNVTDPTIMGYSEWVQLLGPAEWDTEWVRYDFVENGHILRTHFNSWTRVHRALTLQDQVLRGSASQGGINLPVPPFVAPNPYGNFPQDPPNDFIGYRDPVETQFPAVAAARFGLRFRGDPFTGTTSHAHGPTSQVLQCHRFELDWGNYGALSARSGRHDRVGLVAGSHADGSNRPAVEWHTVNWVARRHTGDPQVQQTPGQPTPELLGQWPFQLVAFKEPVRSVFLGPATRNDLADVREIDRLVKFPSGELPAAFAEQATIGGTPLKDVRDLRGIVDEVAAVRREAVPVLLDEPLQVDATKFVVRPKLRVTPVGSLLVTEDLTARWPKTGLCAIDGEILAFTTHADGTFEIARNGRGLLNTVPRAHDEGVLVQFLEHVPAAILSAPMSASAHEVLVTDLGVLPRASGTLLAGRELLHYTWTIGNELLVMPMSFDPRTPSTTGRGLFRGRYGTRPQAMDAGQPVIWFPFRYWDRNQERSEDPELAHFQCTWHTGPVWFRSFYWDEDRADAHVDLHCHLRVDGSGSFADDPNATPGQFLFEQGRIVDDQGTRPNPLGWQGSRIEARFRAVYKPGAFDPATFLSNSWKKAPSVRAVVLGVEGESRILSERITAR
jgi:hypothetical protein